MKQLKLPCMGTPAVLPMEIVVPSIRVALQHCLAADDYTSYSLRELEGADEARLKALDSLKLRHELRESIKKVKRSGSTFSQKSSLSSKGRPGVWKVYS
jgi:hypothetical protein